MLAIVKKEVLTAMLLCNLSLIACAAAGVCNDEDSFICSENDKEGSLASSVRLFAVLGEMPCACPAASAELMGSVPRSYISAESCNLWEIIMNR